MYVVRVFGTVLGAAWLVACVVGPTTLQPAATQAGTVVSLPVAPVRSSYDTPWVTPQIVGYTAHAFAEGEDLESLAAQAGSSAELIQSYNILHGIPRPGRPLILPHLAGYENSLPETPLLVARGDPTLPYVALTLDAGAGSAPVPEILAALRERDVQITFFLTGTWIEENPELVQQIVADGHELANHSRTHADFTTLSDAEIVVELAETERLASETGASSIRPFFRPPYGAYDRRVLLTVIEQGYLPIYWTLDSLDSVGQPKTPEFLLERMTGTLSHEELQGAIILAHCGSESTAAALPQVLDRFAAMGLEVRTLSEVLGQ
jgi:peptidoglycan/xylan/chitin deacetylase (PgdA/CDA1 family)